MSTDEENKEISPREIVQWDSLFLLWASVTQINQQLVA